MTRTEQEPTTLSICADCLFYLANGEVTDGEGNDITLGRGGNRQYATAWETP